MQIKLCLNAAQTCAGYNSCHQFQQLQQNVTGGYQVMGIFLNSKIRK